MPWLVIDGATIRLKPGQLTLGRATSCDIVVSDDMTSRHHVTFATEGDRVSVRDMGSRNGTLLNGTLLIGTKMLNHLDRIVIGNSEIVYYATSPASADLTPLMSVGPPQPVLQIDGEDDALDAGETQATNTVTGTGHLVVGGLVSKSLDAQDLETAGRIIQNLAQRMMVGANDRSLSQRDLAACSDIVMRFADATEDPRWVEWILNIHAVMAEVPSRFCVDVICSLGAGLKSPAAPRAWLKAVRNLELSAEQRFLLSRIEGLERQLSA